MKPTPIQLLFVEDNADLRDDLGFQLQTDGIAVTAVSDAKAMDEVIRQRNFDIALLDIGLPGEDGLSIATRLRSTFPDIGIIILTALDEVETCLKSYQHGADIFMAKPVDWRRLSAQIAALYRRVSHAQPKPNHGSWQLLQGGYELVSPLGASIPLTGMEAAIVLRLAQSAGQTITRDELIAVVSPGNVLAFDPRRLEVCVSRLRQKIQQTVAEHHPAVEQSPIKTVRGVGYVFSQAVIVEDLR